MPWKQPNPNLTNSSAYLEPRMTAVETTANNNSASLAQIATNVKSFGAKGDGITDDTVAIQNAINSVSVNGGTLYFPDGTYLCIGVLNFNKSNVTYLGSSKTTIRSTYGVLPFLLSGTNIKFSSIEFINANTGTDGVTLHFLANTSKVIIKKCKFTGKYGRININATGISDVDIIGNTFTECAYGILVDTQSIDMKRLKILNNTFTNLIGEAIELNTPSLTRGQGIHEVIISGNTCTKDLVYMTTNNISLIGWHGLVGMATASDVVIEGNTIDGFYFGGIDVEGMSERIVIQGNKIKNGYGDAPDWVTSKAYKVGDMVKYGTGDDTTKNIYYATTAGTSGATPPSHTSGTVTDDVVSWLYLVPHVIRTVSSSKCAGIYLQDTDFSTVTGNSCERTGIAGLCFDQKQGYQSDDGVGNVYSTTISGNVFTKSIHGIYMDTTGKNNIVVNSNICTLNNDSGLYVNSVSQGITINDNVFSENKYGISIKHIFTEMFFSNNITSKNTVDAITLIPDAGFPISGAGHFNKLTAFQIISAPVNASQTPNQPLFTLGSCAKGIVTIQCESGSGNGNIGHAVFDITWDGTTLTQTKLFESYRSNFSTILITVVSGKLNASIYNNGGVNDISMGGAFQGTCIIGLKY